MAELNELRIRLEGALETVEAAAATMTVATEALEQGIVAELVDAMTQSESPETRNALAATERLSEREPSLIRALRKFSATRETLRARVLSLGPTVGLGSMSFESIVTTLAKFPVLYSGVAIPWRSFGFGAALLVASSVFSLLHPVLLVAPISVMIVGTTVVARSPRLVVTAGHIRIGSTTLYAPDIDAVSIRRTIVRLKRGFGASGAEAHTLSFHLRGRGLVEIELLHMPPQFVAALERVVKVERT